jgi:hypothetical protein
MLTALLMLRFILEIMPDKIDRDGVPVYRTKRAPAGLVYRKRSLDDILDSCG